VSHDPYTDAIKAAAAAITAPYRDPETVIAFVDAFPMLAAARALNAALPHLRETLLAEVIPAGPCPAHADMPWLGPQGSYALCDLRAGHAGQHEAESPERGNYRWSDNPPKAEWCESEATVQEEIVMSANQRVPALVAKCEHRTGHAGYHQHKQYMWDECGNLVSVNGV